MKTGLYKPGDLVAKDGAGGKMAVGIRMDGHVPEPYVGYGMIISQKPGHDDFLQNELAWILCVHLARDLNFAPHDVEEGLLTDNIVMGVLNYLEMAQDSN